MKVFSMDDYTWWAGADIESVTEDYLKTTEVERDEIELLELTDEEMERFRYHDDDGATRSFREQLERMIADGTEFPCFFASTEY